MRQCRQQDEGSLVMTEDDYKALSHACVHEFMEKNRLWLERFGISDYPRWDYDDTDRLLIFSGGRKPGVECEYVNVGSYSTNTGTWMWAWANESVADDSREGITRVRDFGVARGIAELSEPHFEADEDDGWAFAAFAGHMLGAEAVYRPVADHLWLFMLVMKTRRVD